MPHKNHEKESPQNKEHVEQLQRMRELYDKMEKVMDKKRFLHTLGVANTAACMAMRFDVDPYRAYLAGLLHDNAKSLDADEKKAVCRKYGVALTKAEKENHELLHAKAGSILAREKYGIDDDEILSAIRYHTTGKPDMTTLEKIIYIADYIEINRKMLPEMDEIRRLAFTDLDECVYHILRGILAYLQKKEQTIDELSDETFRFYEAILKERGRPKQS